MCALILPLALVLLPCASQADELRGARSETEAAWQARLDAALSGEDPAGTARAGRALARFYMAQGHLVKARHVLRAARAAAEQVDDLEALAAVLSSLGLVHHGLHEHRAAISFWDRSRVLRVERGEHEDHAACLANIGMAHLALGESEAALAVLTSALQIQEGLGATAGVCRTLVKIADAQARLGSEQTAVATLARALRLARRLGLKADESSVLEALAAVAWRRGEQALALERLDEALLLVGESGDRRGQASVLRHTASLLSELGRAKEAARRLDRARRLVLSRGDGVGACETLRQRGALASAAGRLDTALSLLQQCLRRARRLDDPLELLLVHGELGSVYLRRRDLPQAREHYTRALALARAQGEHGQEAVTLGNLGELWRAAGDLTKAEAHQRAALVVALASGRARTVALCRWGLARTLLDLERPVDALALVRAAQVDILPPLAKLHETLAPDAYEIWSGLQEVGILASVELDDVAVLFDLLEVQRARSLLATLAVPQRAATGGVPASLKLEEAQALNEKRRAARRLATASRRRVMAERRRQRGRLVAADDLLVDVRRRIARLGSGDRRAESPDALSLAACREALDDHEAVILFVLAGSRALAVVVSRAAARVVDLGRAEALRGLCGRGIEERLEDRTNATRLRRRLIEPLALGKTLRRVVVCPQDELWSVPFAVLLPQLAVTYAPSVSTYLHLRARMDGPCRSVLALGDPAYDHAGTAALGFGPRLANLPASREEVLAVGTHHLLGEQATRALWLKRLASRPSWRAVHVASHGRADLDRPLQSALALAPSKGDDGIVTALDVLGMHVPADLVVLSGCSTGQGRVYRSEGMVGLARAFLCVGAKRVLCSLWRVDDEATSALMIRFYKLWNPQQGPRVSATEALHRAQEHVRRQPRWRAPRYWAGWALWGSH